MFQAKLGIVNAFTAVLADQRSDDILISNNISRKILFSDRVKKFRKLIHHRNTKRSVGEYT